MTTPCQNLEPFFDGELDPAAASAFRDHLLGCDRCQAGLGELMRLGIVADRYPVPPIPPKPNPLIVLFRALIDFIRALFASRWAWAGGGLSVATAVLIALLLIQMRAIPHELFQPDARGRLIEGRSSCMLASAYRPMRDVSLGSGDEVALLPDPTLLARLPSDETGVPGRAAAYLVRGHPVLVADALKMLEPLEASADVQSERALAYLVRADATRGDYEAALRLTEAALEKDPHHGPALFNKALAQRALGLDMLAARTFDAVADLGEPGWSGEARIKAGQLREAASARQKQWEAALQAGETLVASGTLPPKALIGLPILRLYFYDAVRSRISAPEVEALRPLARDLDSRAGGTILQDYLRTVARRDFSVRAPLAARYRQLVIHPETVDSTRLLSDLRRSTEEDILIGALIRAQAPPVEPRERAAFQRQALAVADPWFEALALQREAKAARAKGDLVEARQDLENALKVCNQRGSEYRCLDVELELTEVLLRSSALDEAYAHAIEGWRIAQTYHEWGKQVPLIENLAQLARLRDDFPLLRAYLEEAIERTKQEPNPPLALFAHENLAAAELARLRVDAAREHIDAAIATRLPLSVFGALTLSDIARLRRRSVDATAMDAFRARISEMSPGRRALATHALGRFTIEVRPDEGRRLLEDAIAQAKALPNVGDEASQALTYSYTSLILAAGREGDFVSAWARFEEEAGARLPERCMVVAAVDSERTLIAVRSVSGVLEGAYEAARTAPLAARVDGLVPSRLLEGLNGCAEVRVLARTPVYGRAGLLPWNLPWSYVLSPAAKPREASTAEDRETGFHLIVQNVSTADRRNLPKTQYEAVGTPEDMILSGATATPTAVLREIENATTIYIVAHGFVDPVSDEAYLVLAPDGANDALRASQIERLTLRHRPIVILASCGAAKPGPDIPAPRSLPAAFLRAGARAVLAAASDIPEREGRAFFDAVRARIEAGDTAARALQSERASWMAQRKGMTWLDSVLLFN